MTKKRIIWGIIILVIIAGGYFYIKSKKPQTTYTTADVTKGSIAQTVSVTGDIKADDQVELAFKNSGRLRTINVDTGDVVKKGQLLGSLEPSVLNAQLKEAREQVKVQKNTLDNMKRRDDTYNKDQRDAQRAQVRAAQAGVDAILTQFGDSRLFSPIAGVVLKRNSEVGEIVSPTGAVLSIGNPQNLIIESNVPESDIIKIKVGQKANVTFDAFPADQIFAATVTEIDPASTVIQDVVSYRIKLSLAAPDENLKPGMSANIDVKTAEKNDVLMIPLRGVKTEDKQKFVDILIDAQKNLIERKNITTGLEGDDGLVEVVSGLNGGEKVVTFVKTP
ncbi:MAG: efflux RND transporter periplasmic adaptor subunit [Parcubacteria group bacterium]|jgi:RND family efflux transporter MFP subunit